MRQLLITLLILLPTAVQSQEAANFESRLRQIDEAIAESPRFVAQREAKIASARHAFEQASGKQKYEEGYRLYELYRPFVSDSAIYFLRQCIMLAEQQGDYSAVVRCRSQLAIRCTNIGMYDEALNILDSIEASPRRSPLQTSPRRGGLYADSLTLGIYYEAYNNVYSELSYYTRLDDMREMYQQKEHEYAELMYQYLSPTSEACFLRREQRAQGEGNLKESMAINDEWLKTVEPGSHPYALTALYRYIEYKLLRDSTQMMYWLTESVLADIRNAAMDQGSMWELANELMLKGDLDRALFT